MVLLLTLALLAAPAAAADGPPDCAALAKTLSENPGEAQQSLGPGARPCLHEFAGIFDLGDFHGILARAGPPAADQLPALIKLLELPSWSVRINAARALKAMGGAAAPARDALLSAALRPQMDFDRNEAIKALMTTYPVQGPETQRLARKLFDAAAPEQRPRMARALCESLWGLERGMLDLLNRMARTDPEADERRRYDSALYHCSLYSDPLGPAELARRLGESRRGAPAALAARLKAVEGLEDPKAREAALSEIARLGPEGRPALPWLVEMLRNQRWHPELPRQVWEIRSKTPPEEAQRPALTAYLSDPDVELRWYASELLESMGPAAAASADALRAAARAAPNDNEKERHLAAALAVDPVSAQTAALLKERFEAAEGAERSRLGGLLLVCGPHGEWVRPELQKAAREGDEAAIRALTAGGDSDKDVAVSFGRLRTDRNLTPTDLYRIGRLGPEAADAVADLTARLSSPRAAVRSAAAWALGRIGPPARPAAAALKALRKDPSYSVRLHAKRALAALGADRTGTLWWAFWR